MDMLQKAALDRAKSAILFAFSEPMRLNLLAETGIDKVEEFLHVGRSPDSRLHVLLPEIEKLRPDQALALLLTCAQALIDAVEKPRGDA